MPCARDPTILTGMGASRSGAGWRLHAGALLLAVALLGGCEIVSGVRDIRVGDASARADGEVEGQDPADGGSGDAAVAADAPVCPACRAGEECCDGVCLASAGPHPADADTRFVLDATECDMRCGGACATAAPLLVWSQGESSQSEPMERSAACGRFYATLDVAGRDLPYRFACPDGITTFLDPGNPRCTAACGLGCANTAAAGCASIAGAP